MDTNVIFRLFNWLGSASGVILMAYALVAGLEALGMGLVGLPDAIRRRALRDALGVVLMVTMCAALFSVGAGLWLQCRPSRPETIAAWRRAFRLACGIAVGLMLLVLTISIAARM
jgi:uncharacterized membrane protein